LGSPIRTSPDHRMLASPRGFSQLATSFFAYLRQGIPTHALSSLTIKLTPHTECLVRAFQRHQTRSRLFFTLARAFTHEQLRTCLCYPSDIQLSNTQTTVETITGFRRPTASNYCRSSYRFAPVISGRSFFVLRRCPRTAVDRTIESSFPSPIMLRVSREDLSWSSARIVSGC
jgi:hypothetical protein